MIIIKYKKRGELPLHDSVRSSGIDIEILHVALDRRAGEPAERRISKLRIKLLFCLHSWCSTFTRVQVQGRIPVP